jgi:hypothetical protein
VGKARAPRDELPPIQKPFPSVAHSKSFMCAFKPQSPPLGGGVGWGAMKVKGTERELIELLTYDLFSLNFPVTDYMLIPSFTHPYSYHVKLALGLQCVNPEMFVDFARFNIFGTRIVIEQRSELVIRMSIHKDELQTLPAIVRYLLKLIHVLCFERPS